MIKNKYYIGQRVRVIGKYNNGLDFVVNDIHLDRNKILTYSGYGHPRGYEEHQLEPLPEKQKVVLWQWLHKSDGKWYQHIASENAYRENHNAIKVKIVEEVEI